MRAASACWTRIGCHRHRACGTSAASATSRVRGAGYESRERRGASPEESTRWVARIENPWSRCASFALALPDNAGGGRSQRGGAALARLLAHGARQFSGIACVADAVLNDGIEPTTRQRQILVELFVEELPPKALQKLGDAFATVLGDQLKTQGLASAASVVTPFASPAAWPP